MLDFYKKAAAVRKLAKPVVPYLLGVVACAGWLAALGSAKGLSDDWKLALRTPLPHQYGEGIMIWMSREIGEGRWPYGKLLDAPSRYSCYGPLAPFLAAITSKLVTDGNMKYVQAGRLVNYAAWSATAFLLAFACTRRPLPFVGAAVLFLSAIASQTFFWTFRVDSVVLAAEALILALLSRAPPSVLRLALPAAVSALTLAKPPAVVDLVPITMLAVALRGRPAVETLKIFARPMLVSVIAAPAVFFALDTASGFAMSNNILWEQMSSGSTSVQGLVENMRGILLSQPMWVPLLWAAFAISSNRPAGSWMLAAIAISFVMAGTFSTKYGADVNYYIPTVLSICAAAASHLRFNPRQAPVMIIAMYALCFPLDQKPFHRSAPYSREQMNYRSESLRKIHDQDNFITEDPFFSVLAGRQPMLTDMFQFTIAAGRAELPTGFITKNASGAWGGDRLNAMLARQSQFSREEGAVPMGISYVNNAVWYSKISSFSPRTPPYPSLWRMKFEAYARNILFPGLFLLVLALTPSGVVLGGRRYPPQS